MITVIPGDVPLNMHATFRKNCTLLTKGTGNLFLFSADHKIEHLDKDFHGIHIPPEAHHPEHLFKIAQQAPIGGLATQLGLIARYGGRYPDITYVVKLNAKNPLIPALEKDPLSTLLWTVNDAITFQQSSKLSIAGVGMTVYLGSKYEDRMLEEAAQGIFQAHQNGLVAILWMYPRGKAVPHETDPELLAGAVGVATCLGADFVKIHAPPTHEPERSKQLAMIVEAAGNTGVIIAGGSFQDSPTLLKTLKSDMERGIAGAAIGRSIFQRSQQDAVSLCNEIAQCIYPTIKKL